MTQWLVYRMGSKEMWLNSQERYEILVCVWTHESTPDKTEIAVTFSQNSNSCSCGDQFGTTLLPARTHTAAVIWQLGWQRNTS